MTVLVRRLSHNARQSFSSGTPTAEFVFLLGSRNGTDLICFLLVNKNDAIQYSAALIQG
jgi:hypothetical protein